nr:hypothetical protein [uncultured Roseococcus sp.]
MNATTFRAALAPSAAATTAHPDADLIAACREHAKTHAAFLVAADDSPEQEAYIASLRNITGVIPETFGGVIALTDAIMVEAITENGKFTVEGNIADDWCFQVVRGLHAALRGTRVASSSEEH